MNICYCFNSIDLLGGVERVTINKANMLSEMGHNVAIVVTDHKENVSFVQTLSDKVKLIDLNIGYWFGDYKWHSKFTKRLLHYIRLRSFVKGFKPDVIISCGQEEKQIIPLIPCRLKIREIHLVSSYRSYCYKNKIISKILDFFDYKLLIHFYDKYILLTHEDHKVFFHGNKQKAEVIHNPLTITPIISTQINKSVITCCRLDNFQKQINEMIDAFAIVSKKHPDWLLKIYGDGPDKNNLQEQITRLKIDKNVILMGRTNNVPLALSNSSIYCMTSAIEGFPLSLTEAMSCGLPVVTYQFPCGAKDILEGSDAGYLVPMHNIEMLADKICYLIEHEEVRKEMSKNAIKRAQDFEICNIMNKWINLFEELIAKKNN